MKSISFHLIVLLTLVLSGCGGKAASTSTSAATQPPPLNDASTNPAIAVTTPTLTLPAISPTAPPTNQPDCTDDATFVSDITVPDGTNFNPETTYTKTWRISNSGTCSWNSDYSLVFASGEKSGAPDSKPLAYTAPGGTLDISVELTTPTQKGTATTNFQLRSPSGKLIAISGGIYLYVSVYVSANTVPTVSNPAATEPASTATSSGGGASGACPYTTDRFKVANAITAINNYRAQNGLPAYHVNPLLTLAAETHAADMACNNLFGHNGSDGSSAVSRVGATGYVASTVTENVYGSFPPLDGPDVVAWWASDQIDPRHNENLISTKYIEIGVAYTFYNEFGYYVVDFAASRNN
jgi:uncharacterized protein YkwD